MEKQDKEVQGLETGSVLGHIAGTTCVGDRPPLEQWGGGSATLEAGPLGQKSAPGSMVVQHRQVDFPFSTCLFGQ